MSWSSSPRRRLTKTLRHAGAWAAMLAVVLGTLGALCLSNVRSEDRNNDGVTDAWNVFDAAGRLAEASIDTDFDGYPDVREYYADGALIRREIDRDRDRRVDVIEEFGRTGGARFTTGVERDLSPGPWTTGAPPRNRAHVAHPRAACAAPRRGGGNLQHLPLGAESPRGPPASA